MIRSTADGADGATVPFLVGEAHRRAPALIPRPQMEESPVVASQAKIATHKSALVQTVQPTLQPATPAQHRSYGTEPAVCRRLVATARTIPQPATPARHRSYGTEPVV